ncbi:hypothetical protein FRC03_001389 [Tulasnella sp. 419]|nr:hypothetical protein FRC03_001389 [Tulasnella sp. 419]
MINSLGKCIDLGLQIKSTFKQVGPDRNDCAIVSEDIVDLLLQIRETLEYRSFSPADELHESVSQFEIELRSVIAGQRRLYKRGKNGVWSSFVSKTQETYHADNIKYQLVALHQRIQTCNKILQQSGERIEVVVPSSNGSPASPSIMSSRFTSDSIREERLLEDRVDESSGTLSQVHIQGSDSRNPNAQTSSQSGKEVAQLYTDVTFDALDFTGRWTKLDDVPTSVGGNSDIYKAELDMDKHRNDGKQLVAIKVLRSVRIPGNREISEILKKRLMREMTVWSQLHHDNVVPFLGYGFTGDFPCLIAPWYANGHIPDYMTQNPNIDRTPLIMGVIDGLVYLHSFDPPIIHGDLKASNVLADDQGHARITDFGLSRVLQEGPSGFTTSSGITGTHRWMAPELFMTEGANYNTASDIYAMSLLILEIYTGKIPFSHLNDILFLMAIIKPTSPDRSHYEPCNIVEGCWRVFERGWSIEPSKRPSVADFKRMFNVALEETSRESSNNLQVRYLRLSQSSEPLDCVAPKQTVNGGSDVPIKAYEEEVKIGRELVEQDRQARLPYLSLSLHNLGSSLRQARKYSGALEVFLEAVKMRRELVERDRQTHLPDLFSSLHNLGSSLGEAERYSQALEVFKEAVKMCRELGERDRQTHLPDLILSLHNLGDSLVKALRYSEALEVFREAVKSDRDLVERDGQTHLPDLFLSLHNLGSRLLEVKRYSEALEMFKEAVKMCRELVEQHRQTHLPDLSLSLHNSGYRLGELQRYSEALEVLDEAIKIRRELVVRDRQTHLPDLSLSLHNLGYYLGELQRYSEALDMFKEAVKMDRELVERDRHTYLPRLSLPLHNLGYSLVELRRYSEAMEVFMEAVKIDRELVERNRHTYLPHLSLSLHHLGSSLGQLRRHSEALEVLDEAIKMHRELVQRDRHTYLPNLSLSLHNLGYNLEELQRHGEALEVLDEAIKMRRELVFRDRQTHLPSLSLSLHNLGCSLVQLQRPKEALEVLDEAVKMRRELVERDCQTHLPSLSLSLHNLGWSLEGLQRHSEALEVLDETIKVRQELAQKDPATYGPQLIQSMNIRSTYLELLKNGNAQ